MSNGRSPITHRASVLVGRVTGTVTVDASGCVRFTMPCTPNFYSADWMDDAERQQIRSVRRRVIHELIEAHQRKVWP